MMIQGMDEAEFVEAEYNLLDWISNYKMYQYQDTDDEEDDG